ncbi:Protein kinase-like domain protein [Fusarium austroafricanum]|uniref:Protein kinase-like domain protein n=1 Tax=Fusarium austroafricanum TaxID=2364996 RepID=A0A8H4NLQ6_9HYPO|nr:Protein kinase-like domain protein [Fusarium austroafricanum]
MTTTDPEYSVNDEIISFFTKTSATRSECDARANELTGGGKVVPIEVEGVCSYSVYAGPDLESVVEFRPKSLQLKTETCVLARKVYGSLAPSVSFAGEIGDEASGKEPLCIYVMNRIKGVTYLDFILANGFPENSETVFGYHKNVMADVAKFCALSWNAPLSIDPADRDQLQEKYIKELTLLHTALPKRFQPIIQKCIDSMDGILSLPMVLLYRDFRISKIMVDKASCHIVGVMDWAEAEVSPFGLNLHSIQALTGNLHLWKGWSRYDDFDELQDVFWSVFQEQVGALSEETLHTIKQARITGLLLSPGFTSRVANEPEYGPINDDEQGPYNMMMSLDGFLIYAAINFN